MTQQSVHILISGIVQGVGYRWWSKRIATELEVCGWSRNLVDGRVEILAEGSSGSIEEFVNQCHIGPASAAVEKVVLESVKTEKHHSFEIWQTSESVFGAR